MTTSRPAVNSVYRSSASACYTSRDIFVRGWMHRGNQLAFLPYNDPTQLPIQPVRDDDGEWLFVEVDLPGRILRLRIWQVMVGQVSLYLLDSNDPLNSPADRGITSELYGGGSEMRLQQEIVLGIGGYRLLHTINITPEICHLNEWHAAFVVLEWARFFMLQHQVSFQVALTATRAGNLFTTHTPVEAGFDRFAPWLFEQYMKAYAADLGISDKDLLEDKIIPAFYQRNAKGIPERWVHLMRHSMAELTPRFSANRMVREYTEKYYIEMAAAVTLRTTDATIAGKINLWKTSLEQHWSRIRFSRLESESIDNTILFTIQVYLDDLAPEAVQVELYAEAREKQTAEIHPMENIQPLTGTVNGYIYTYTVTTQRPETDYTIRVVPSHPYAKIPLEAHQILWEH